MLGQAKLGVSGDDQPGPAVCSRSSARCAAPVSSYVVCSNFEPHPLTNSSKSGALLLLSIEPLMLPLSAA
ncbi:hypothetical protein ADK41_33220 [Streptomyces caelestis]|uniref:Uncharacterized protein n=1 Tax=Streptomyces caelestis TaxID=36816 RepID=A0A0M8QGG0_9ACTN|nr:hypothetical protein ADK41_33220 [Streptomyces caelestis]KOV21127.1 hypothetical protein ADK58_32545 [Streptomyces sp. XY152]